MNERNDRIKYYGFIVNSETAHDSIMSSVHYKDNSCTMNADKISCDAMSFLAKDEYYKNKQFEEYLLQDPSCFRYQALANREEEHALQKNGGLSRNVCFEKTEEFQKGPWEATYVPQIALPTFYDKWTRAKNGTLTCQSTKPPCTPPLTDFPGPFGFSLRK